MSSIRPRTRPKTRRKTRSQTGWAALPTRVAMTCCALVALQACGEHEGPGKITGPALPPSVVATRSATQVTAARTVSESADAGAPTKRILFGDLHVHSTFSADAFMFSLPFSQGEGAKPVADACDYARYCSGLDFWSMTDHAESLTPERWAETVDTIRQCDALVGDQSHPDLVSFLGWEWTQVGTHPGNHYGHKNVIVKHLDDDKIPARPIHSKSFTARAMRSRPPLSDSLRLLLGDWGNRQRYFNLIEFQDETRQATLCDENVDTRELPLDCMEDAATPEVLFRKLNEWGHDTMVIPHGTTWGIYTPRGSAWDKQLVGAQHDPNRQRLIEVYSGHGNSEEYRNFKEILFDADGSPVCPPQQGAYEPCCRRAGEIIRSRCEQPGEECERRVTEAQRIFLESGTLAGRTTIPGASLADWKDCGSCPDCFNGSMNYRPRGAVQYIMALSDFGTPGNPASPGASETPRNFDFGFMASSDNHRARPGTGYKEVQRQFTTEAFGAPTREWFEQLNATEARPATKEALPYDPATSDLQPWQTTDFERQASFFMTGGLVAVHAHSRTRDDVWDALARREVYGTSGDRILLWFDMISDPERPVVMGEHATVAGVPRFQVRAVGAREQLPGCPEFTGKALTGERIEEVCHGECFNPGNTRRLITRVEIVRIRPQAYKDEPIADLIDDPWKILPCPGKEDGCVVEFEDAQFQAVGRKALYYARAIQAPTPAINADGVRCRRDADGNCIEAAPCYGDYRTPPDDDCLALNEERAWSSPIFLTPAGG